jgi:two-component sensor histidine kinase
MKLKKTSLFLCALFFLSLHVFSQKKIDSTGYYRDLISNSKNASELVLAYKFFKKEKEQAIKQKYYIGVAYSALQVSNTQHRLGQYYDSETSAIEGLKYLDSIPLDNEYAIRYRGSLLNRLGILKRTLQDYEKSLKYYFEFLAMAKTKKDSAIAYNNIGNAYKYLHKNFKAKESFEKAYSISRVLNDMEVISLTIGNLGYMRAILGEEKEGLSDMKKALQIKLKYNSSTIYESYKNIIDYYKYKNDRVKALYYAKKGYKEAKEKNISPYIEDVLSSLIDLKAYEFIKEYKENNDSIKNSRKFADNKYASYQYNYTQVELEREREKTKRKEAESRQIASDATAARNLFIAIFILIVSFFFFYTLRVRYKKGKLKTQFDTERKISKKLHDEVANDVYFMMSRLENNPNAKKEWVDDLEEIYLKTRDISKAIAAVDVSTNFDELLKDLIASYKTQGVNIFTRNVAQIPWNSVANLKKETLYRVIQELMTNMKKHSKASLVTIQFEEKQHKIVIRYVDNGIGCQLRQGNGLHNTENRMAMVGGSIIFESEINKGFQAKLVI